ncbi:MAG: choice-of-anchor tandem repeat GloVer-containing protein, partial [Terriglobales bacterium]
MRGKRFSIELMAALAIFTAILLVTGIGAAAQEKVLYTFQGGTGDGAFPQAGLIFDTAGNLYGTTSLGGAYGFGTVFELTPTAGGTWTEKVLYSFKNDGTDGSNPKAGVIFDAAGNLYGTTSLGGAGVCQGAGCGTVFELTPAAGGTWTEKVLHSFGGATDGVIPEAGLIFDAAGNLYGTTGYGGPYNWGTVFELTPAAGGTWTENVLYSFQGGADGAGPAAGLVFDAAGNLYGTTEVGGAGVCQGNGCGTVFELTPAAGGTWTENVLYRFQSGADGANPYDALIFDAAGNLYG